MRKILSASHVGLRNWLLQRITALVMALYMGVFAVLLVALQPADYLVWRGLFVPLWVRLFTLLFFLSLMVHAWLGMCDIFNDYVPSLRVEKVLQGLVAMVLLGCAGWSASILWSIPVAISK